MPTFYHSWTVALLCSPLSSSQVSNFLVCFLQFRHLRQVALAQILHRRSNPWGSQSARLSEAGFVTPTPYYNETGYGIAISVWRTNVGTFLSSWRKCLKEPPDLFLPVVVLLLAAEADSAPSWSDLLAPPFRFLCCFFLQIRILNLVNQQRPQA